PSTPPSADELETGRKLGALIAKKLAADIQAMSLSAVQAGPGSAPQVGDGVIRGYLVSVEGGSAGKRFVIGLGGGTSEMDPVVEGYAVTPQGWRQLGSGTLSSSGNKTPGVIMPSAVAIATGNPIGLIVVGALKLSGEASGRNTLEGRAKATADAIAEQLKIRFRDRGWISWEGVVNLQLAAQKSLRHVGGRYRLRPVFSPAVGGAGLIPGRTLTFSGRGL